MKLTKREKNLLIILGIILVVGVFFMLYLMPQLETIQKLEASIQKNNQIYLQNISTKDKMKDLESELKILIQKIEDIRAVYPPTMYADELLELIKDTAVKSGIKIKSLSVSEPILLKENTTTEKQTTGNKTNTNTSKDIKGLGSQVTDDRLVRAFESIGLNPDGTTIEQNITFSNIPNGKAYSVGVKITVTTTNEQLKAFFEKVILLPNKVAIKEVQIIASGIQELNASISLELYGIKDTNVSKYSMIKDVIWTPEEPKDGKSLFDPYIGIVGVESKQNIDSSVKSSKGIADFEKQIASLNQYDFTMLVRPFGDSVAPPSISLTGDHIVNDTQNQRLNTVYGDNKGIENVEIVVSEVNGKIMCKFRTDHEAFPNVTYSQMVELKTSEDATKLLITSMNRKFEGDVSGMRLTVLNKTKKPFRITVVDDDKSKPRISFGTHEGNVVIDKR